jgi:hypothetical protein
LFDKDDEEVYELVVTKEKGSEETKGVKITIENLD